MMCRRGLKPNLDESKYGQRKLGKRRQTLRWQQSSVIVTDSFRIQACSATDHARLFAIIQKRKKNEDHLGIAAV